MRPWFRYICPPRVLNYRWDMNAEILRGFGANISDYNVRLLSPITLHRADLKTDFSNLTIGVNAVLNGNNYLQERLSHTCGYQDVLIKEGAGIKAGAVIVVGVTIGRNAVIEAQALVNRDVQGYCFVAGVPSKVVKDLSEE